MVDVSRTIVIIAFNRCSTSCCGPDRGQYGHIGYYVTAKFDGLGAGYCKKKKGVLGIFWSRSKGVAPQQLPSGVTTLKSAIWGTNKYPSEKTSKKNCSWPVLMPKGSDQPCWPPPQELQRKIQRKRVGNSQNSLLVPKRRVHAYF